MAHWVENVIQGLDIQSIAKLQSLFISYDHDDLFDPQVATLIAGKLDIAVRFTSDNALRNWLHANPQFLQLLLTGLHDAIEAEKLT